MGSQRVKGSRALVAALLAAAFVGGCGGDEEAEAPEPEALTVCEALEAEPTAEAVRIDGTAHRVQTLDTGFVLAADGCAIFAAAPMGASPVEQRAEIWLEGQVSRLDDVAAERLKFVRGRIADRHPFRGAPVAPGEPFVNAFSVQSQPSEPQEEGSGGGTQPAP